MIALASPGNILIDFKHMYVEPHYYFTYFCRLFPFFYIFFLNHFIGTDKDKNVLIGTDKDKNLN